MVGSVEERAFEEGASGVGKDEVWSGAVWCSSCMIHIAIPGRDLLFVLASSVIDCGCKRLFQGYFTVGS